MHCGAEDRIVPAHSMNEREQHEADREPQEGDLEPVKAQNSEDEAGSELKRLHECMVGMATLEEALYTVLKRHPEVGSLQLHTTIDRAVGRDMKDGLPGDSIE